ncbi:MAG: Gfo/Idh/MocA family oxidoreductase [Pseudomonadota bacterium]
MKNKVLIIGAGQLGSRHLQGVLLSKNILQVTVVDPSHESLSISKERAAQVEIGNANTSVTYQKHIPENEFIDVCIIATAAHVRAKVTQQLLETNRVNHIIFEKVLFQKLEDYAAIKFLLKDRNVRGWVNCPRRLFPAYQDLKSCLNLNESVDMTVTGNAWGMACNSIHFIDLFAFLVGNAELQVNRVELDSALIESKRAGNYEVTGTLEFSVGNNFLKIVCEQEQDCRLEVKIENGSSIHLINEIEKSWLYNKAGDCERRPYASLLQSQLTGIVVTDLIASGQCQLTPLSESSSIHIPFVSVVLEHISSQLGVQLDACPIT